MPQGTSTFSVERIDAGHVPGSATIYFECADLDERADRLIEHGVAFEHEPVDQPWLWRERACAIRQETRSVCSGRGPIG